MKGDHLHAFENIKDGLSIFNPVYLGDTSPIFESHKITDIAELIWMSDNLFRAFELQTLSFHVK